MALLTQQEVIDAVTAMIAGGIDSTQRGILFQAIDPLFKGSLPSGLPPTSQLMFDIGQMNSVERFANGDIPLLIYFTNALVLLAGAPKEQKIIRQIRDLINQRAAGAPRVEIDNVPETKELIIHTDDTLPYKFMAAGVIAAKSVVKLKVPAFENGVSKPSPNGTQVIANGSGWLLTPSLIITNHHVVNARKEGEPDAAKADLLLQGKNITVIFDYDEEDTDGTQILSQSLEAWNKELDYAIFRVPDTGRKPIRVAASKIIFNNDSIPVNIIQHPNGRSKRFAIRNNLISASTDTDLRYFTDTEGGSSGSPVLNDTWEAVAIHKGATYAENVHFQGKEEAYVNVGTHLSAIFENLQKDFPGIAGEII